MSVLVPVTIRAQPLDRVYRENAAALREAGIDHEFVFILDSAAPAALDGLAALRAAGEPVRILVSPRAMTEGTLTQVARVHTRSPILVTLPSYPRVVPAALPEIVRELDAGTDLVTAARANRGDPSVNRFQRRLFHFLLGRMVGGPFRDIACGVRAMRREVLEQMDLYGDFFRFIPMLALRDGFGVREVTVEPHPLDLRTRVYAPGIYLRRLVDLVGLMFLVRFTYKPLRFFGLIGSGLGAVGGIILVMLLIERLGGRGIADRPMLLLGVLLVVLGLQALALGLIGEIVVHHNVGRRPLYRVLEAEVPSGSVETAADAETPRGVQQGAAESRAG